MPEIRELLEMIDEAVGNVRAADHQARDMGHRQAESELSEIADKLEQLHCQLESEYPEHD